MVKIGVANGTAENSEVYEAVDLLDVESAMPTQSRARDFTILESDSESGSGSDSGSEEATDSDDDSSDESDGVSDDDGTDEEADSNSGTDTGSSEEESGSSGGEVSNSSSAVTARHNNFMAPIKRAVPPSSADVTGKSPHMPPPQASFKAHTKRFPSLRMNGKDKKGRHQRLATDDDDEEDDDDDDTEEQGKTRAVRNGIGADDRKPLVAGKAAATRGEFKVHDPSQFPLEQYTDSEYGVSTGVPPETYSYSSANPNSIDYNPQPLRKMDAVDDRTNDDKWQKRIICWGLMVAMTICLLIMIGSIVAYQNRINVRPAPKGLLDLCSMKNIGTEKGHRQCKRACKEAECCMAAGALSCFLEQEDVCREVSELYPNLEIEVIIVLCRASSHRNSFL